MAFRLARAAVTTLAVVAASPASAHAAFPGTNGLIAFDSQSRGELEASYVANADGTGLQRFPIAGKSTDPAWSSDGSQLAFTVCQPDGCSYNDEIYKIRSDGTGQVNLTNDPSNDWAPAWSPDGTKIAFTSARGGSHGIWVMNADGAIPTRLTSGENPAWSPDGARIAFQRFDERGAQIIFVINPDGSGLTPVTDGGPNGGDFEPNWSPDGSQIAFSRVTGIVGTCPYDCTPVWDVFTVNADGTGLARLTDNGPVQDREPAWSPDGTKIAYTQTPLGGSADIVTMNPDGSGQTKVTDDSPPDGSPDWQPIVTTDLSVTNSDSPDPVNVGDPLTYTLTVKNSGPQIASGVTLTDFLDKNMRFLSASSSQGSCAQRQRTVTCQLGSIGPADTVTVTVVVRPTKQGTAPNTVSVAATQPTDPNTANNTATALTQVLH